MENASVSTNLALDVLTPATSVRAVDGHSPHQDAQGHSRRQSRRDRDETDVPAEPGELTEHQLDRLA
jgi:hypothetical protein